MIVDACIYIYCTLLVILIVIHQFGYGSRMGHQHPWLHVPGHIATTATKNLFIPPQPILEKYICVTSQ